MLFQCAWEALAAQMNEQGCAPRMSSLFQTPDLGVSCAEDSFDLRSSLIRLNTEPAGLLV